jgi:hypothetical protein
MPMTRAGTLAAGRGHRCWPRKGEGRMSETELARGQLGDDAAPLMGCVIYSMFFAPFIVRLVCLIGLSLRVAGPRSKGRPRRRRCDRRLRVVVDKPDVARCGTAPKEPTPSP